MLWFLSIASVFFFIWSSYTVYLFIGYEADSKLLTPETALIFRDETEEKVAVEGDQKHAIVRKVGK